MTRSYIFHLVLITLLLFSSGVQAWTMQADLTSEANSTMEMTKDDAGNHCQSQAENSDNPTCQHDHCSMCLIGLAVQHYAVIIAPSAPTLPFPSFHTTDLSISQLYRPPRHLV